MSLNEQRKRFCEEYVIDLNGKQAAIRAGYSAKTAEVKASSLLSIVKVQDYIAELRAKQQLRTSITSDMVINELAKLAFSDIRDIYDDNGNLIAVNELPESVSATISSFKSRKERNGDDSFDIIDEYRRYDKIKALELLGKHFKIFDRGVEEPDKGTTTNIILKRDE